VSDDGYEPAIPLSRLVLLTLLLLALTACSEVARLPISAGIGPQPTLPPPQHRLIPSVHIAPAQGWPSGTTPLVAPGSHVVADLRSILRAVLNSSFGMVMVGNDVFVANSDAVLRYPYVAGDTRITAPGIKVVDLPAGPINQHWTRNLIASPDGSKLYVTVGPNSNVAERIAATR
jgi:hypothetical protein